MLSGLGEVMLSLIWGMRSTIGSKLCGVAGEILTWGFVPVELMGRMARSVQGVVRHD